MKTEPESGPLQERSAGAAAVTHAGAESHLRTRVQAVDILRGLVMVIMALDHTRDFVHAAAMAFQPEDLAQTTPAIFMTRWCLWFMRLKARRRDWWLSYL